MSPIGSRPTWYPESTRRWEVATRLTSGPLAHAGLDDNAEAPSRSPSAPQGSTNRATALRQRRSVAVERLVPRRLGARLAILLVAGSVAGCGGGAAGPDGSSGPQGGSVIASDSGSADGGSVLGDGGCTDGGSHADLCAGVSCDTPPAPTCLDGSTLREYAGSGTCSAGICSYAPADNTCPAGCSGGACTVCTPSTWTKITVDADGDRGAFSSLAVDSAGGVHVSYYSDELGTLRYAYRNPTGTWTTTTVATGGPATPPRSRSTPRAASTPATRTTPTPTCTTPTAAPPRARGPRPPSTPRTAPATSARSRWTPRAASIAVDRIDGSLRYAYRSPTGTWTTATVDDNLGKSEVYTALAVDSAGGVHVSYYDELDTVLRYAYLPPPCP